jgi:glyceraldehyde-3-phosphate dehydrogenase (ferredoxin)
MYERVTGEKVDDERAKEVYRMIAKYSKEAKAEPVPWESAKARDVVVTMARRVGLERWAEEPYEWWKRFKERVDQLLQ